MKELISDTQYIRAYRSAGLWFVGMYMEAFLLRIDELVDDNSKAKLIEEIYDNGENTFDKDLSGTRTRVNSLYRIIKAGREIEALKKVIQSDRVAKENPQAIIDAKDLLIRIKSGDFKY